MVRGWGKRHPSELINHHRKFYLTSQEILTNLTYFKMLTFKQN